MKTHHQKQIFLLGLILPSLFFQGCVPIATGVIAYDAAITHEEAGAYTDYFFSMQAANKARLNEGQPAENILSETRWLKEVHQPRLDYAEYYSWNIDHGNAPATLVTFENWNQLEHIK